MFLTDCLFVLEACFENVIQVLLAVNAYFHCIVFWSSIGASLVLWIL